MHEPPSTDSPPVAFVLGDVVRLRKAHACGGDHWLVDRLGADIGLRCQRCGRHVMMDRRSLERRLVGRVDGDHVIPAGPLRGGAGSQDR